MRNKKIQYLLLAVFAIAAFYVCLFTPGDFILHQVMWLAVLLLPTAFLAHRLWAFKADLRVWAHPLNRGIRVCLTIIFGALALIVAQPWDNLDTAVTFRIGATLIYAILIAPIVAFLPYYPVRYRELGQLRTPKVEVDFRDAIKTADGTELIQRPQKTLWDLSPNQAHIRSLEYVRCTKAAVNTLRNRVILQEITSNSAAAATAAQQVKACEKVMSRALRHCDAMGRAHRGTAGYIGERTALMANSYMASVLINPQRGLGEWQHPLREAARGSKLHPTVLRIHELLQRAQSQSRQNVRALNSVILHARKEGNSQLAHTLLVYTRTLDTLIANGLDISQEMLKLCPDTRAVIPQEDLQKLYTSYVEAIEKYVAVVRLMRTLTDFKAEYEASLEVVGYIKTALKIVPLLHRYVARSGNQFYAKYARHCEETLNDVLEARSEVGKDAVFFAQLQGWVDKVIQGAPTDLDPQAAHDIRLLSARIGANRTRRLLAEISLYAIALTPEDIADTARLEALSFAVDGDEDNEPDPLATQPQALEEAQQLHERVRTKCMEKYPELASHIGKAYAATGTFYADIEDAAALSIDGVYLVSNLLKDMVRKDRLPHEHSTPAWRYWPESKSSSDTVSLGYDFSAEWDDSAFEGIDFSIGDGSSFGDTGAGADFSGGDGGGFSGGDGGGGGGDGGGGGGGD